MKTYIIDKFRLNGNHVRIKFEPYNVTFFKVSIIDQKYLRSVSIPLLLEAKDVLNSMLTLWKLKKSHDGSLEYFGMIVAGAVSMCMKFKKFN